MRNLILAVMLFILSAGLNGQELDGVHQIKVKDGSGKVISSGTAFKVYSKELKRAIILTSFHLLNSVLLGADHMSLGGSDTALSVIGYDELNDILVLDAKENIGQALGFSDSCEGSLFITGYHKGSFITATAEGMADTRLHHAKRLPVYLTKGFSGAPVLNSNADVCGMVVLSSEQNASSIAVTSSMLERTVMASSHDGYNVSGLRALMGVEYSVGTQKELDSLMTLKNGSTQIIIRLRPSGETKDFIIKGSSDVIVESDPSVRRVIVHNSNNVLLRGLNISRVMINESSDVSIISSLFEKTDRPILIKDSKNVTISGCTFRKINTGVVLKSSELNQEQLAKDNEFSMIQNMMASI